MVNHRIDENPELPKSMYALKIRGGLNLGFKRVYYVRLLEPFKRDLGPELQTENQYAGIPSQTSLDKGIYAGRAKAHNRAAS